MSSLRLSGLTKRFTKGTRGAVEELSLDVADGEFMALLGPSGCGKTTTLQLIAGFYQADSGQIWAGDKLISDVNHTVPPERRGMSLVFQSYAIWPHKTVRENVAFGLEMRKRPKADIARRVDELISAVRLDGLGDRYPVELSGGQQQRVALARAIAVEPTILLLDEPLSNLDATLRDEMRFEIRRLHQELGLTMVYVTHDQSEAMVTADRIAILNAGRVEQVGTPTDVYERPRSAFVATFIGRANLLPGTLLERGIARCGDIVVRASDDSGLAPGADVLVCVRPHDIALGDPDVAGAYVARVVRDAYLGDARDYLLELPGGAQVRAVTRGSQRFAPGDGVGITLPPEACRVLAA
ncbi:MAG: ABC transporter ATP-binding protein [Vulcanimicrobiaceae bacterium]